MVDSGMNRYSKGKIYKVVNIGYNKMYIGSTVESLSKRMERRRSKYKEYLRGDGDNTRVYWLFDEFGVENCRIELIDFSKFSKNPSNSLSPIPSDTIFSSAKCSSVWLLSHVTVLFRIDCASLMSLLTFSSLLSLFWR